MSFLHYSEHITATGVWLLVVATTALLVKARNYERVRPPFKILALAGVVYMCQIIVHAPLMALVGKMSQNSLATNAIIIVAAILVLITTIVGLYKWHELKSEELRKPTEQ